MHYGLNETRNMAGVECESDMDCSDSDCGDAGYDDYYSIQPWDGEIDNDTDHQHRDPEYVAYECLRVAEVERFLDETVESLSTNLHITPSLAKLFLHANEWSLQNILLKYQDTPPNRLVDSRITISESIEQPFTLKCHKGNMCTVCFTISPIDRFSTLSCGHFFCKDCWCTHFEIQVLQGISTGIYLQLLFRIFIQNLFFHKFHI